jgi:ABC-type lipoprotein export system ATPase subunit
MITVSNLSFQYSPHSEMFFPDFTVRRGEHFLLLGESGSGKTTLLYLLAGLLRKYSGSITIDETAIDKMSEHEMDKFRGQKMGFVFQRNHLIASLTVEQNLMMPAYLSHQPIDHDRIIEVLTNLGVADIRTRKVTELSHGQAQRVAIARAVMIKPTIILADEPTSSLDDKHCSGVISLLAEVASENQATLLIATHDQRVKNKIEKKILLNLKS